SWATMSSVCRAGSWPMVPPECGCLMLGRRAGPHGTELRTATLSASTSRQPDDRNNRGPLLLTFRGRARPGCRPPKPRKDFMSAPSTTTVRIGNSELGIYPLGLGTNTFNDPAAPQEYHAILDGFVERGGTFIDTADMYSYWV